MVGVMNLKNMFILFLLFLGFPMYLLAGAPDINNGNPKTALEGKPEASATATDQNLNKSAGPIITISDGSRISFKGGDISIIPPKNWEVHRNADGMTALFQIPYTPSIYQRTIKILFANVAFTIDEYTLEKFSDIIMEKAIKSSLGQHGYHIRNKLIIELKDGSPALLYYTAFTMNDTDMMEMHILTSSSDGHYLLTYTDVAQNFESDSVGKNHLDLAYESMTSVELDSKSPGRFDFAKNLGLGVGSIIIFLVTFHVVRKRKSRKFVLDVEELNAELLEDDGINVVYKVDGIAQSEMTSIPANNSTLKKKLPTTEVQNEDDQNINISEEFVVEDLGIQISLDEEFESEPLAQLKSDAQSSKLPPVPKFKKAG